MRVEMVRYGTGGSDPTPESPLHSEPSSIAFEIIELSTFHSRGRSSLGPWSTFGGAWSVSEQGAI